MRGKLRGDAVRCQYLALHDTIASVPLYRRERRICFRFIEKLYNFIKSREINGDFVWMGFLRFEDLRSQIGDLRSKFVLRSRIFHPC